jgi:ribonuclease HI
MQQDHTLTFGQINKKLQTGKHTIQHWTTADSEQRMDNEVPYKLIKRCGGCSLNDRRVNKENRGCFFNKDRTSLTCINRVSKYRTDPDTRIIKDIIETRGYQQLQQNVEHSPSYIQVVDYDTALIQNTLVNNEAMTQHIALLQQIRSTFNPSDTINIYTDGSLTNRFNNSSNTFTKYMGTGWVILNSKDEVILECSSSITDWPSSTRAELGAILSAILVLQTGQKANILTDSQAAIDSINYIRTNLTNGKNKTRIWCKCNNHSIVSCIINLIDSKQLEIKLVKVKGHSGVKGNEEADRVAKNDTNSLTCIKIKDSQQKDLIYDIYWDGIRVDRHIRKFIDNLCESTLDAAWSLNHTHRSVFSDTTDTIEEEVTWTLFKKNTGSNCTTSMINDRFIKHLKLLNYLLPTLEIMKERRYDLYGDVKCRFCLEENEDDNHMIYCKQLSDKWITIANNTVCKCNQTIKNFLLQEKNIQLSQEDIQQLLIWNRNFFTHTIDANPDLPIPHIHLMIRSFFPKEKYRELKIIVKTKRIALTIAALFLEVFVNEFYNIIWQPRCKVIAEWEHTKGIKKQDLRKKPLAHQRIVYKRILTLQTEDGIYDLEKRKILKHNEQWSIALEKARQYINQFIKEGNRVFWKVYNNKKIYKYNITLFFFFV